MVEWVVFLGIGLVAGIGIGLYLSHIGLLRSKKQLELEAELHHARDSLHQYRQEVAQHFVHTSTLINEMTQSYRAVFDHLSTGARKLCGSDVTARLQDIPQKTLLHGVNSGSRPPAREAADAGGLPTTAPLDTPATESDAIDEHEQLADATPTAGHATPASVAAATDAAPSEPPIDAAQVKSVSESEPLDDEHADFAGEQDAPPGKTSRTVH